MLVLLIDPLSSCALGLAGNTVGYTGHSRWNLTNSFLVSIVNTLVSLALIPSLGLVGAAIGTAVSTVVLNVAEVTELRLLEGVRLRASELFHPYLAALPLVAGAVLLWDPGQLEWMLRVPFWAIGLGLYAGLLWASGMPELRRSAPKPAGAE